MDKTTETKKTNIYLPNTFQHPNFCVDKLHYYLTSDEVRVLDFVIRHILGWTDKIAERKATLSLSFITEGNTKYFGTGLGVNAAIEAVRGLTQFNIIQKIGKPSARGQEYYLTEFEDEINWDGLEQRKEATQEKNAKKAGRARAGKTNATLLSVKRVENQADPFKPYGECALTLKGDSPYGLKTLKPNINPTINPSYSASAGTDQPQPEQQVDEMGFPLEEKTQVETETQPQADNPDMSAGAALSQAKPKGECKPKREKKPSDPLLMHPAMQVYRRCTHYCVTPDNDGYWRKQVAAIVGETPAALEKWNGIITDWVGKGWNKLNIQGLLEVYQNGFGDRRKNGKGKQDKKVNYDEQLTEEEAWKKYNPNKPFPGSVLLTNKVSAV